MLVWGWFLPGGICLCWVWWGQWPLAPTCFLPPPLLHQAGPGEVPCHQNAGGITYLCWVGLCGRTDSPSFAFAFHRQKNGRCQRSEINKVSWKPSKILPSCSIHGNHQGSLTKTLPLACCGQQLRALCWGGNGALHIYGEELGKESRWLCTQEICGTAGNRSQVLTMPICLNHKSIFSLSFKVTCMTKPSSASLFNLPFYHLRCSFDPKFGKTDLALKATKWCNISVFLSSSRDMRKILSKDFSLSHVLLLAPWTRAFRRALVCASSFMWLLTEYKLQKVTGSVQITSAIACI